MQLFKIYLIITSIFLSSLLSNQNLAKDLAKLSANSLYNLDNEQIVASIEPYLKGKEQIKAVKILDFTDNSIFMQSYTKNNKIIFFKKIPSEFLKLEQFVSIIKFNNETIGKIIVYYKNKKTITFTKEELKWIKNNTITIGVEQWSPIVFSNNSKDIDGIAGDFTKKIIEASNLKIKIVNKEWDTLLQEFKNKKIDILPATYYTDARAKYGLYSKPYFKMKNYLYVKSTINNIHSFKDLENKKLAIVKGYGTIDSVREKFPNIDIVLTENLDDSINQLLNSKVDAIYDGQIAVDKKITDELINGVKAINQNDFKSPDLHYFVNPNKKILLTIIQKVLDNLTTTQRNKIFEKWFSSSNSIEFTNKELAWLEKEISIKYSFDPQWEPLESADELKEHTGIISDIIKLIEQKSGIDIQPIYSSSWQNAVQKIKDHQTNALSTGRTIQREKYMNFTKNSILKTPYVFVTKTGVDYLYGFKDAKNKKIAVLKESTIEHLVEEKRPNISFLKYKTDIEELEDVRNGKIDIAILNAITAKYYINTLGYKDLKIAYKTEFNLDLKIAISKNFDQEALSIIDKSLNAISEKEISDIVDKWTRINVQTKTDWILLLEIGATVLLIILLILWNNRKLNLMVKEKTKDLKNVLDSMEVTIEERTQELNYEKNFINSVLDAQENFVITSDGKELKTANKAFYEFYNIKTVDEFINNFGNCICDTFDNDSSNDYIKKIMGEEKWLDYVNARPNEIHKTRIKKDNQYYIFTITSEKLALSNENLKTAIFTDITTMENAKKDIEQILSNILLPVLITSKKRRIIVYANKYAELQYEKPIEDIIGSDIDNVYTIRTGPEEIIDKLTKYGRVENLEQQFKTFTDKEFDALLNVTPITYQGEDCYIGMVTDITEQKKMENEVRAIHKHTRDSIEYASLIQGALIPDKEIFDNYYKDSFVIWHPKDIVGGDIYLFDELRDGNECLIMSIDCTGHGVPGAFVTMLVKAIERQVIAKIEHDKYHDINISPAWILAYFNKKMKQLLKQDNKNSLSNAGFDGGIIYYNKKEQILKFSGAETPLFYFDENGDFKTIKGSRQSVGYKKCNINYEYQEHIINVKEGMKFYITTDGYLDQNGGEKDFPFGKKRFTNIIKDNSHKPMSELQSTLLEEMTKYESMVINNERNDDITVIGFEIKDEQIETLLEYKGELTQGIISHNVELLENKIENINILTKVSTIVIELTQNMMNYSKSYNENDFEIVPAGFIEVIRDKDEKYYVTSRNVISVEDKNKIEPVLNEIVTLDISDIKKRYKELRRSGVGKHEKGGGIGFYEIAKLSNDINFKFKSINKNKFNFELKINVEKKKK